MSSRNLFCIAGAFVFLLGLVRPGFPQSRPVRPVNPFYTGYTLLYGSGVIMTPHAYMGTDDWNLQLNVGTTFPELAGEIDLDEGISLLYMWRGRVEAGITAYSVKDYGIPAKVLVIPPGEYWPAVSVGALNLLGTSDIGRHGAKGAGAAYDNYIERASPYAVASYAWHSNKLPLATSLSLGWGGGHFSVDNPLYSRRGRTYGIFGAAIVDYQAGTDAVIRFAAEHDAWDFNLALSLQLRGAEVTIGALSLEEGGPEDDTFVLNQARLYFRVGTSLRSLRRWTEPS